MEGGGHHAREGCRLLQRFFEHHPYIGFEEQARLPKQTYVGAMLVGIAVLVVPKLINSLRFSTYVFFLQWTRPVLPPKPVGSFKRIEYDKVG